MLSEKIISTEPMVSNGTLSSPSGSMAIFWGRFCAKDCFRLSCRFCRARGGSSEAPRSAAVPLVDGSVNHVHISAKPTRRFAFSRRLISARPTSPASLSSSSCRRALRYALRTATATARGTRCRWQHRRCALNLGVVRKPGGYHV